MYLNTITVVSMKAHLNSLLEREAITVRTELFCSEIVKKIWYLLVPIISCYF